MLDDAKAGRSLDVVRLDWLLRATARMDALLDALLHYSRLGRLSSEFVDTDLGPVLVEAIDMLGGRLAQSKVDMRVPRPLPVASCDRVRVREVYANLIANAIKYNDKPQPWVEVGYIGVDAPARPASTPRRCQADTILYVRDNGIGIDERHKDRVFALFKRLHGQDEFGGGSGAGLTIARKMVEQHRGCIWFDSLPGVGTTFYFTLPGDGYTDDAGLADLDAA
jgi:light-regulated signal transduction histidine kinase (bacteriophytochrome)